MENTITKIKIGKEKKIDKQNQKQKQTCYGTVMYSSCTVFVTYRSHRDRYKLITHIPHNHLSYHLWYLFKIRHIESYHIVSYPIFYPIISYPIKSYLIILYLRMNTKMADQSKVVLHVKATSSSNMPHPTAQKSYYLYWWDFDDLTKCFS